MTGSGRALEHGDVTALLHSLPSCSDGLTSRGASKATLAHMTARMKLHIPYIYIHTTAMFVQLEVCL